MRLMSLRTLAVRALALGVICGGFGLAAQPAHAIVVPWSGAGNNAGLAPNLDGQPFLAPPALGDTWQIVNLGTTWQLETNGGLTPSIFNWNGVTPYFSNSLGSFATGFQYTINSGVSGINPVGTQLVDVTTGKTFAESVTLANQRVTFTAPFGSQLSAGDSYLLDINFLGAVNPAQFSFAALWTDSPITPPVGVPEPAAVPVLAAAAAAFYLMRRRSASIA